MDVVEGNKDCHEVVESTYKGVGFVVPTLVSVADEEQPKGDRCSPELLLSGTVISNVNRT